MAPPTTKGLVTMETILETLPNVGDTVAFIISSLVLYKKYADSVSWDIESMHCVTGTEQCFYRSNTRHGGISLLTTTTIIAL